MNGKKTRPTLCPSCCSDIHLVGTSDTLFSPSGFNLSLQTLITRERQIQCNEMLFLAMLTRSILPLMKLGREDWHHSATNNRAHKKFWMKK